MPIDNNTKNNEKPKLYLIAVFSDDPCNPGDVYIEGVGGDEDGDGMYEDIERLLELFFDLFDLLDLGIILFLYKEYIIFITTIKRFRYE
jgi:hypothetical protein